MKRIFIPVIGLLILGITGCYKELLPKEKDFFSNNMNYNQLNFQVNLGRTNVFINIFNADYSTQPLDFFIENIRHEDSTPAPELLEKVAARQWKDYYSGNETSIEQVESKYTTEQRPVLDMRPHSGEIFFWNTDSSKVKPGIYYFDVRVRNGGGEKLFRNMMLDVRRPRPYDPYEFDDKTGLRKDVNNGGILHPDVFGIVDNLNQEIKKENINVYFHKAGTQSNKLTYRFFDQDSMPIKLSRFNMMQWDSLKYMSNMAGGVWVPFAFHRQMAGDSSYVTYDITNPFPVLADVSGNTEQAGIHFIYNRVSFGHRVDAGISFGYAIYEPGEWEIIFKFKVNPKFNDD